MLMPIDSVYDADTIKTHFSEKRLPPPLNKVSIRIMGIDAPENPAKSYKETGKLGRAGCIQEAELALEAKQAVIDLIERKEATKMKLTNFSYGKFGGRILADVKIGGVDIATFLIKAGLAVEYNGEKKTHNWCE